MGKRIAAGFGAGIIPILAILIYCHFRPPPSAEGPDHQAQVPLLARKPYNTARLFNGVTVKSSVESIRSDATALHLEGELDSYELILELHLQVPKPATTEAEVLSATPELEELLPHLKTLLENGVPSPDYQALYEHKEKNLRANLDSLQRLLPRDTLYDCQTILNLENPRTERAAILIQAIMNVNTDGSDGDRNFPLEKPALFFQPQTNYRWPKATKHPNPYLHDAERQFAEIEDELLGSDSLSAADTKHLKASLDEKRSTIAELKRWSFLVGTADPFIVLPSFMFGDKQGAPAIGDYAIVIAKGMLYPAIVGDKGPSFKIGEASLRICRAIDPKSTADLRPIDHPKIVYLLFPGSAEKPFDSPNYQHWSERCHALWKEFGGSDSASWKEWNALDKPWPTPTPTPTPSPNPSPSPTVTPTLTPPPNAVVAPPSQGASDNPSPTPEPSLSTSPASSPDLTPSMLISPGLIASPSPALSNYPVASPAPPITGTNSPQPP